MKRTILSAIALAAAAQLLLSATAYGQGLGAAHQIDEETANKSLSTQGYSPYAGRTYPTQVYWGDQHVHTGWSVDAGGFGTTLGPEEAIRFARGEEIISSAGNPVKLSHPLDWVVISDHSDMAGSIFSIRDGDPAFMKNPRIKKWHDLMQAGKGKQVASEIIASQSNDRIPAEMKNVKFAMNTWRKNTAIMEQYNEPGRFTALIGFEWTCNAGGGNNLHRNVIYRDGKALADQMVPMTTFDSENPEDLWKWMATYEEKTFGSMLAIPHNGNLSNGRMFEQQKYLGGKLTKEWAEQRARWEPVYEVVQMKGDGEAHPMLSPTDEFADYETWDAANLAGVPKKPEMLQYEYAREALKQGLKLEKELGANPFKFGLAGGTDTHTALATAAEENFFGKTASQEPNPDRWKELFLLTEQVKTYDWQMTAAGWTGVWATENTREALWDAMKRRETYATTGSRILVRFFGGFDFEQADAQLRLPAEAGYEKGVPMGGDLSNAPPRQSRHIPGGCHEGSPLRQSRPHPDHQGLDGRGRQAAREGLRRRLGRCGQTQAGCGRQAAAGGQHGQRREGNLDQHHRRPGADHGLEGPGLRSQAARLLLRACARDPDTPLDRLRRQALQRQDVRRGAHDHPGAGLHEPDLVYAVKIRVRLVPGTIT